jgi:hypothetical protein
MLLCRHFTHDEHTYRLVVTSGSKGWDVREEQDAAVLRSIHRDDWHRVERDVQMFELKALAVERDDRREFARSTP